MAAAFSAQQVSADDFCSVNYFSCKIKGKQVALCGAELGDVYNIMFIINIFGLLGTGQALIDLVKLQCFLPRNANFSCGHTNLF